MSHSAPLPPPTSPPLPMQSTARMSPTIDLNRMEPCILNQIIKKFTFRSGVTFYSSCSGAKGFVDYVEPLWHLPNMHLLYEDGYRSAYRFESKIDWIDGFSMEKFCRIKSVSVCACEAKYLKEVVLPDIEALGAVGELSLVGPRPDEEVRLLLAAAKPVKVRIWDSDFDATTEVLKSVKSLDIVVNSDDAEAHWTAKNLFEVARNRKNVTLCFYFFHETLIRSFLENWLLGKATGSLDRLSFIMRTAKSCSEGIDAILHEADIQKLIRSLDRTEDGYFVEGELGRLCISVGGKDNQIDFQFL